GGTHRQQQDHSWQPQQQQVGESSRPTVAGLSTLARQAYSAQFDLLTRTLGALGREYVQALRNRAEVIMSHHFPDSAYLPFEEETRPHEFTEAMRRITYALHLGRENTVSPEAAAAELAQFYAAHNPEGYGTRPVSPHRVDTTPITRRVNFQLPTTRVRTPIRTDNTPETATTEYPDTQDIEEDLDDAFGLGSTTSDSEALVGSTKTVRFGDEVAPGSDGVDDLDDDGLIEEFEGELASEEGDEELEAELRRGLDALDSDELDDDGLIEEFEGELASEEGDEELAAELRRALDALDSDERDDDGLTEEFEDELVSPGDGDDELDAEFARAFANEFSELDDDMLVEGEPFLNALGTRDGMEVDLDGLDGDEWDYLALAEATRPRGARVGGDEGELEHEDERGGEDGESSETSSLWSEGSDASYTDEVTGAGLKTLLGAADREAAEWEDAQPAPGQFTKERVRRFREKARELWGPEAFDYPVLVEHYNKLTTGRSISAEEIRQTLLVLSLTPHGLATPVDQLGRWLRPTSPPTEQQLMAELRLLKQRNDGSEDVPTQLGPWTLPPGQSADGQRRASVVAVLEQLGIEVWERGRLTVAAVTVLGSWVAELGARHVLRRPMADVEAIAQALFGHTGERAVAFVEFHLTQTQISHPARPLLWGRSMDELEDGEPATGADRQLSAVAAARRHWTEHGSVNAREIAKVVAGHADPTVQELHEGLEVLEFSGFTGHIRGTDLWHTDRNTSVMDESLEAQTMTDDDQPIRDEQSELTEQGRELLKAGLLRIASTQAARLGGVDLDALMPQVFALAHRHRDRRTARRWLHEADLRVLTR
ncbi:hypothetical protein AB0C77_38380, partial [Streptomyces sp. NPDC048629]|uniref:hypothetical protein n=1 Tax=Streptomyces sp. NPDC048629 TaxID=3154824 RepID=UPI00341FDD79